jgi:hypothetical protein
MTMSGAQTKMIPDRANLLYELLKSAKTAHTQLRDLIEDDVDSCDDDEDHLLHNFSSNAYKVLRSVENLIIKELQNDIDGELRSEFEKLATFDVLKSGQNPIKYILKIAKPTPPHP